VPLWHEYSNADDPVALSGVLRGFEFAHAAGGPGGDPFRGDGIRSPARAYASQFL